MAVMAAIVDFQLEQLYFLPSFESISLSVQEKKVNTGAISDFRPERFQLFLMYKSPDTSYQVSSHLAYSFQRIISPTPPPPKHTHKK